MARTLAAVAASRPASSPPDSSACSRAGSVNGRCPVRSAAACPVSPHSPASTAAASAGGQPVEPGQAQAGPPVAGQLTEQAQPGHPAVRVDLQADMADQAGGRRAEPQPVPGVGLKRSQRQQLEPFGRVRACRPGRAAEQDRRAGRVAQETRGVQHRLADVPGGRQAQQHPVMAGVPAPPGLPPVAHHRRPAGADHVLRRGVEPVAGAGDRAAVLERGEVQRARPATAGQGRPRRRRGAWPRRRRGRWSAAHG